MPDVRGIAYRDFSKSLFKRGMEQAIPIRGQFALTYRCGLRCQMCYTDCYNSAPFIRKELPTEKILSLLDEIRKAGCLWLCFTGGDPLVHPDFEEIYLFAKKRGFLLTLFTNGISMTEKRAEFFADNRPFVFEVTQYGATKETYEEVTQIPGSFERFQAGIERIMRHRLPLKLKVTLIRQNAGELTAMRQFARSLGVPFQFTTLIQPRLNGDVSPTTMRLSPEEVLDLYGPEEKRLLPPATDELIRCATGINSFAIDPYGKLLFCVTLEKPSYDLTQGPFLTGFQTLYSQMRSKTYQSPSFCRECEIYALCNKCPAHTDGEADPEEPIEFYCKIAHGRAKRMGLDVKRPVFWKDGKPSLHEQTEISPVPVRSA